MNKYSILILATLFLLVGSNALARNTLHQYSITDVMQEPENISKLEGVSFYFGDEGHPSVKKNHGEFRTNKKTNAFNKSDLEACQWVMMSALLQLRTRAQNEVSSETEYTCGAGTTVAGVALIGTVVELE